jgi:hypothetical protein
MWAGLARIEMRSMLLGGLVWAPVHAGGKAVVAVALQAKLARHVNFL